MPILMSSKQICVAKYFLDYSGGSRLAAEEQQRRGISEWWLIARIVPPCALHCYLTSSVLHCKVYSDPVHCIALHSRTLSIALYSLMYCNAHSDASVLLNALKCIKNVKNIWTLSVPPLANPHPHLRTLTRTGNNCVDNHILGNLSLSGEIYQFWSLFGGKFWLFVQFSSILGKTHTHTHTHTHTLILAKWQARGGWRISSFSWFWRQVVKKFFPD